MSDLYKRTNYLNKDIEFLFGEEIIEYDIQSAGFNIIKKFKFLPDETVRWLESLDKHTRHVKIGLLERDNEVLKKNMKRGFVACRKKLFIENHLQDEDILSIKKDAIFVKGLRLTNTEFDNIHFIEKNVYTSFLFLNKIEFYMNDETCDIKGINDILAVLHKDYMLDVFREFAGVMRHSVLKKQLDFVKEVASAYRRRDLRNGYYRELNRRSLFRPLNDINILNSKMGYNFYEGDLSKIDISYNYMNYFIPLFRFLT